MLLSLKPCSHYNILTVAILIINKNMLVIIIINKHYEYNTIKKSLIFNV